MTPQTRKPTTVSPPTQADFFEAGQQALVQWVASVAAVSQEVAQFTQVRLQQDMETCMALAECKTPQEAVDCQMRYVGQAVTQYFDELGKLPRLVLDISMAGSQSMAKSGARPVH